MSTTYCVIIDGIADAGRRDRVIAELAFTFKRSHEKTARMLAKVPYAVRKGVDFRTAVKYETLLRNCGCLCKIETEPCAGPALKAAAVAVPAAPVARPSSSGSRGASFRRYLPQVDLSAWTDRLHSARHALPSFGMSWTAAAVAAPLLVAALYVAWSTSMDTAAEAPDLLSAPGAPAPGLNPSAAAAVLPAAAPASADLAAMTRSAFEATVRGKSEAQIIAAIGPPTLKTEDQINGTRMALWTYYDRTRLTDASALDKAVFIELRDGRAESLLY